MSTINTLTLFLLLAQADAASGTDAAPFPAPNLEPYLAQPAVESKLDAGDIAEFEDVKFPEVFGEETLEKDDDGTLVMTVVPVTLEQAWRVITDYEAQPKFLPGMKEAKIERRDGNTVDLFYVYRWGLPMKTKHYFTATEHPAAHTVRHVRDETRGQQWGVDGTTSFWHARKHDDGTVLLVYYQHVEAMMEIPPDEILQSSKEFMIEKYGLE